MRVFDLMRVGNINNWKLLITKYIKFIYFFKINNNSNMLNFYYYIINKSHYLLCMEIWNGGSYALEGIITWSNLDTQNHPPPPNQKKKSEIKTPII